MTALHKHPRTLLVIVAEAALETGDSASAIKVQVHRGLKRLAARVRPGASEPRTGD